MKRQLRQVSALALALLAGAGAARASNIGVPVPRGTAASQTLRWNGTSYVFAGLLDTGTAAYYPSGYTLSVGGTGDGSALYVAPSGTAQNALTLKMPSGTSGHGIIVRDSTGNQQFVADLGGVAIGPSLSPAFSGFNPILTLSGATSNISGVDMANTTTGAGAEFRFAVHDPTDHSYIAFSMPAYNNTATLFGLNRSGIATIFTNNFGGSVARAFVIGTVQAAPLVFGTSNSEQMRISPTGNVGIGTTAPASPLDVSGAINASTGYKYNGTAGATQDVTISGTVLHFKGGLFTGAN